MCEGLLQRIGSCPSQYILSVSQYYIFVTELKIKSENSVIYADEWQIINLYLQLFNLFRSESVEQLKLDMTVVLLKDRWVVLELKQFQ